MKTKFIILLMVFLILSLLLAIIATNWNKHIIFLKNGTIIQADKTWVVFDEVFYEKKTGSLDTVKTRQVDRIVSATFSGLEDWKLILGMEMSAKRGIFGILLNPLVWTGLVSMTIVLAFIYLVQKTISLRAATKHLPAQKKDLRVIHISANVSDFKKILLYFLNLYLLQSNAKKDDRYAYQPLEKKGPLNTIVYEYKVLQKGHWQSRRISVGRIGEESGARSTCFYVIYDDHFVVKMPPEPITDFDDYFKSIQADSRIAEILSPRECLVPRLSIVLKKIPEFSKSIQKYQGDDEQKCIEGLKTFPEYKEFLKIAGSYAFFMDLSKYYFLGYILNECHDTTGAVEKEVNKYQDSIWIPDAFADRYGEEATSLCFDLQKLFNLFDQELRDSSAPQFQKKSWFKKMLMANDSATDIAGSLPSEAAAVFEKFHEQHSGPVKAYQQLVRKVAREQMLRQNMARIQSICSRMTELLAWLFFKDIAIRDLKPDNLLVAGDPSQYPLFLSTAHGFELGLIDVEIAAYVGSENPIAQPKLGWTPLYATPSHLFVNDVLTDLYDDTAYILKLQDWYAVIAMIYEAITGDKLFVSSASALAGLARELPLYFDDMEKLRAFAKKAGVKFWQTATREFESKLRMEQSKLQSLELEIFKNAKKMFETAAEKSKHDDVKRRLLSINSQISAFDFLNSVFYHVREEMFDRQWEPLYSEVSYKDNGNARPDEQTQVI